MIRLLRKGLSWTRNQEGASTIEFCIWLPFVLGLFGSAIEASFITQRQALLSGALDRTVRDLQLGNLGTPSHADLKKIICNKAGFIPNCLSALHIEQERILKSNFQFRTGKVQCVDLDANAVPALNYTNGLTDDLMLITVCAAIRPMVPLTGLGLLLPKIENGKHYAIVAFSAYVVEP